MKTTTLEDIRPDGTGKYSDTLYRWCRKELRSRIYRHDDAHHLPRVFAIGDHDPISVAKRSNYRDRNHTLWIGLRDAYEPSWVYGFWVAQIANPICRIGKLQTGALPSDKIKDVTEWFWKHYLDMGTCFIIGDLAHDWIQINRNARKCRHCLKHERREVVTRTSVKRVEVWGSAI